MPLFSVADTAVVDFNIKIPPTLLPIPPQPLHIPECTVRSPPQCQFRRSQLVRHYEDALSQITAIQHRQGIANGLLDGMRMSHRRPRAWLNFIGESLRVAFGTATEAQVRDVSNAVARIAHEVSFSSAKLGSLHQELTALANSSVTSIRELWVANNATASVIHEFHGVLNSTIAEMYSYS